MSAPPLPPPRSPKPRPAQPCPAQPCPRSTTPQSLYDTRVVLEQQLAVDWKSLVSREGFRKFVHTEDVNVAQGLARPDKVSMGSLERGTGEQGRGDGTGVAALNSSSLAFPTKGGGLWGAGSAALPQPCEASTCASAGAQWKVLSTGPCNISSHAARERKQPR